MEKTLTVMQSGNSAVIALPAEWRRERGIRVGDRLTASYSANGPLTVVKRDDARDSRLKAFERLMDLADSVAGEPWEDDSREADRALVGRRYE